MESIRDATLLARLVRQGDRTIEETCQAYESVAREMGEHATLSVRQLYRWMNGDVSRPRPVSQRVARQLWGSSFDILLGPPDAPPQQRRPELDREAGSTSTTSDTEASESATDADFVEFVHVLDQRGVSPSALTSAELTCARFDQQFARLGPDEALSRVRELMTAVLRHLRGPQSLGHHRRLVTLAGRLAGLRAWGCFDIDEHGAAERWYDVAVSAAHDAGAWSLGAWLLGAQSLIPWHRRDFRRTMSLIERGIYFAGQGTDSTTAAWLHALAARGRASLRDSHGFETAYARAEEAAEYSNERDRRHGMDFDRGLLDLRYYAGVSRLLLRQPEKAKPALRGSLAALPHSHTKGRAVLILALADGAVQSGQVDQAVDLTKKALTTTWHQPIMPILQQARRVRRLVHQRSPADARKLDDELNGFMVALADVATRVEL